MCADSPSPVILVIDDDPNNMDIVSDYLSEHDYTILVAEDGESGLARAEYARPDLILLDVMMPGIDGLETCRRLKTRESTRDIPVIFMTALAETGHKVKGFEVGAVDYITKPFQREEVLARVGVHLRIRELTSSLQEAKDSLEKRVADRTAELNQTIDALYDEIIRRKRGEQELLRLAKAIGQAAEGIFITDAHWRISYVNPAFERMSGYSRVKIIGQPAEILRGNAHDLDKYRKIHEIISRDNTWSGQLTTRKKDGSLFEAETTISTVWDANDTIINYIVIQRDVTQELKMRQELRHAQKMEAIGTLAGGIAHDFNNILTAIIGYTEMAQRKLPVDSAAARDLERVQEAGSRAKELVKRILSFSRRNEQELRPVQIAPLIEEVLALLRSTTPATIGIHSHLTEDSGSSCILADPTQIHQILMNLGTNAAHAMRDSGGILSVSLSNIETDAALIALYPTLKPGSYLKLTVGDTGHGMERNVRERIFDPYFTTKKIGEGTGMGLSVVQGIVSSLGGAISVYSEPGQGSTFHIFLPKIEGAAAENLTSNESSSGGTERILFVDDEKILAELGQALLGALGYDVTIAPDGLEALKFFLADPQAFDLVITDMNMPALTGKELAKGLLAIRPDIPVILCTGFSDQIDEKQAMECGIKGYVMKPYTTSSLNKVIRTALAGEQPQTN